LTINPLTGMATVIGLLSDPSANIDGLRFNSQGVLYGTAFEGVGVLVTIDPSNANILSSLTLSGSGNSFCAGIAFDPLDVLYGSRGNAVGRAEDLDLIQPNGTLTPIGGMEAVISDIVFSSDGTLYGSSPTGALYSINPITGAKTLLFNTGIPNFSGLAAPVPEPSASILLLIAALSLFPLMWRRARVRRAD
jgi:outer membrane protein assembly factor BamB